MLAMTFGGTLSRWSGGKGCRVADAAADDPHGSFELDPVGVDVSLGRGAADQGRYGVLGQQVAVDLLANHAGAPGPQNLAGAAQIRFQLPVPGFVLPPLMVGIRQGGGRGRRHLGDGGDQRDQLTLPVAVPVGAFVLDYPAPAAPSPIHMQAGPRRLPDLPSGLTPALP